MTVILFKPIHRQFYCKILYFTWPWDCKGKLNIYSGVLWTLGRFLASHKDQKLPLLSKA